MSQPISLCWQLLFDTFELYPLIYNKYNCTMLWTITTVPDNMLRNSRFKCVECSKSNASNQLPLSLTVTALSSRSGNWSNYGMHTRTVVHRFVALAFWRLICPLSHCSKLKRNINGSSYSRGLFRNVFTWVRCLRCYITWMILLEN